MVSVDPKNKIYGECLGQRPMEHQKTKFWSRFIGVGLGKKVKFKERLNEKTNSITHL